MPYHSLMDNVPRAIRIWTPMKLYFLDTLVNFMTKTNIIYYFHEKIQNLKIIFWSQKQNTKFFCDGKIFFKDIFRLDILFIKSQCSYKFMWPLLLGFRHFNQKIFLNLSITSSDTQIQRPHELLWNLWFDEKVYLILYLLCYKDLQL